MVGLARDSRGRNGPQDAAWEAAIDGATDAQALAVGTAAYVHQRLDDSVHAFMNAGTSPLNEVAARARFNLGVVLGELGRSEDELGGYDELLERFADAPEPALRQVVALAREAQAKPPSEPGGA